MKSSNWKGVRRTISLVFSLASAVAQAAANTAPLELVVLGSGGPGAVGRASSSYLLLVDGSPRILVDAGSGSFVTLGKTGLSLEATDLVLLTHLHVDHVGELPGLFKARAVSSSGPIQFEVWGPSGSTAGTGTFPSTTNFLALLFGPHGSFAYLQDFAAPIRWHGHDIGHGGSGDPQVIYQHDDLTIRAIPGHHGDAPAIIYRVDHGGRSVSFSGDVDEQGIANLTKMARDSDLLVFNTVVLDRPGSPEVLYTLHSSPRAIGETAAKAHVQHLLLSHLSPATDAHRGTVEGSIRAHYDGPVEFAEDGLHVRP